MSNTRDHNETIIRWLNGELSEDEFANFKKSDGYAQYKAILDETDSWSVQPLDMAASYKKLMDKRGSGEVKVIAWYQTSAFRVAAVLLMLLGALIYFTVDSSAIVKYKTDLAETLEVMLPDSSQVYLGPASFLSYDREAWDDVRQIDLEGMAYFEVTHGNPFEVSFGQGTVVVHGTAFEIKSFDDYASVTCYDGKVEVVAGDSSVMLTRGKGVKINLRYKMRAFDFQNSRWSENSTRFNQAPLSVVLSSLAARFGVSVTSDEVDTKRTFTGAFTHSSLEDALNTVCTTMGLTYEKNGDTVILQ
ncbi:DUF4974 domain-containing protein [Fulvivirga sp. M361]|uniref:FecR family protein n=1 Tax=Fulvivirga sp. M361 TaxID=2594266 RepID=UPI00117B6667|nr:FecR family protein [Fulvivirga sp. M361]TRX62607.1 DUF4974 domain-containing protein [Fulvivirga sp. M361]